MWNKIKSINGFYVLISIFCAILVWIYVDVTVEPDAKVSIRNIPVTFLGEEELAEEGLMLTDGKDATVTLTVVGTRAVVSQLNRTNITITVDLLTQVTEAGAQALDYDISYSSSVSPGSVKVRSRSVNSIEVNVVKMSTKTIGIVGGFSGSVAEGYLYDTKKFTFNTTEITIVGEKALVDQVDHAAAILSEKNLSSTWRGNLELVLMDDQGNEIPKDGLTLSQDEVEAVFPVSRVKEIALDVTIEDGGGATADDVTYTISPPSIRVSGTEEDLEGLETFNVGTIDLSQVITSEKVNFPLELPEGISNVSGTAFAVVNLSINSSLTTTKLTTEDIRLVNIPEDISAALVTESLEVRIRGDRDTMKLLVKDDVYAEVDLSDITSDTTGTLALPAEVKVKGMSDVGAIGEYEVTVDLN